MGQIEGQYRETSKMKFRLLAVLLVAIKGLRIDAETGQVVTNGNMTMGMSTQQMVRYSSKQDTLKLQKDKKGQMKKVKPCITKNPLVIISGIWEQKRGRLILRCKDGKRPVVKVLAFCDAGQKKWEITPPPETFDSMKMCKTKKLLKPKQPGGLKPLKPLKNKWKG